MVLRDEQVAPSQEVDTGSAAEQSAAGEAGANPPQATEDGEADPLLKPAGLHARKAILS